MGDFTDRIMKQDSYTSGLPGESVMLTGTAEQFLDWGARLNIKCFYLF